MKVFAVIDEYVIDAETGRMMAKKPLFRTAFVAVNQQTWTSPDGVFRPALCKTTKPNSSGLYIIHDNDEYAERKIAVLKAVQKDVNKSGAPMKLAGPFATLDEAIKAQADLRPRLPSEKLQEENAELRAKLEELERKTHR